jgi:hypothetical protein
VKFLNYNLYKTTKELPVVKKYKEPVVKVSIDEELNTLEEEYQGAYQDARKSLKRLR